MGKRTRDRWFDRKRKRLDILVSPPPGDITELFRTLSVFSSLKS